MPAPKSIHSVSEARSFNSNATLYLPFGTGGLYESSVEARRQIPVNVAGRISSLAIRVVSNTLNGAATLTLRKNGGATSLVKVIAAGDSGEFYNLSDTVDVSAGDLICYQLSTGGNTGAIGVTIVSTHFEANNSPQGTTVTVMTTTGIANTFSTASATRFHQLGGGINLTGTTESFKTLLIHNPGTVRYLGIFITSNDRTTDTILRVRINGANGNGIVTIGAGVTGWVQDLVNTDVIASGDNVSLSFVTGTGTETIGIDAIALTYIATNSKFPIISTFGSGQPVNFNTTTFSSYGAYHNSADEITRTIANRMRIKLSGLFAYVSANTIATSDTSVAIRTAGATTALSVAIGAGATGSFSNTSTIIGQTSQDAVIFASITPNTSGALTIRQICVIVEFLQTYKAQGIGGNPGLSNGRGRTIIGRRR